MKYLRTHFDIENFDAPKVIPCTIEYLKVLKTASNSIYTYLRYW